jgi:hypothetical protein
MRKDNGHQLSLFDQKTPEKNDEPVGRVVSLAQARTREDARQSSQLDSRIIARVAHLLQPGGGKRGA